jgi:hypothetical protein
VVLAQDVVAAQVHAVVGVEVAEEDGIDAGIGVPLRAERSAAEVEQDPPGAAVGVVGLHEVAAGRGSGPAKDPEQPRW